MKLKNWMRGRAETPNLPIMINYLLNLEPLQGRTDPAVTIEPESR